MDVNKALGVDGAGQILRVGGRILRIMPPTDGVRAEFQAHLEAEEREYVAKAKDLLSPPVYEVLVSTHLKHITTGFYSAGKDGFTEGQRTVDGAVRWITLLMRQAKGQEGTTEKEIKKLFQEHTEEFKLAVEALNPVAKKSDAVQQREETSDGRSNGTNSTPSSSENPSAA